MFKNALAFDQDLGWCVDDDVILTDAFLNAPCESTSCGVVSQGVNCQRNYYKMGQAGSPTCPDGYSPIMSQEECSASEVGNMVSRTYTGSFCNSQLGPKGCAMNTGSPEIWFMDCDADTDASWHAPVCKRDWGPPSPAPTTP